MKKIVIGLSGGVDSSVCLYLLKQAYKEDQDVCIEAVFMKNWDSFLNGDFSLENNEVGCESNADYEDAKKVCDFLNVKLHKVEFVKQYWDEVFQKVIDKIKKGYTPNPDVLCNKYIKFNYFEKFITNELNADLFTMGHYAKKVINDDSSIDLVIPKDHHKDQTYFLCELNQKQLEKVIFPLSNLNKEEVRKIAKQANLPNWNKKDSTGICFIGNRDFKKFISNYIESKQGDIIDIKTNEVIGKHNGAWLYTIGQRKGIGLSGMKEKYFVIKKDIDNNIIYVSVINDYQSDLYCNKIIVKNFNWINKIPSDNKCLLRYRHTGELFPVEFEIINDEVIIKSIDKLKSVSIGQYAVLYNNDICCGGGEIYNTN